MKEVPFCGAKVTVLHGRGGDTHGMILRAYVATYLISFRSSLEFTMVIPLWSEFSPGVQWDIKIIFGIFDRSVAITGWPQKRLSMSAKAAGDGLSGDCPCTATATHRLYPSGAVGIFRSRPPQLIFPAIPRVPSTPRPVHPRPPASPSFVFCVPCCHAYLSPSLPLFFQMAQAAVQGQAALTKVNQQVSSFSIPFSRPIVCKWCSKSPPASRAGHFTAKFAVLSA